MAVNVDIKQEIKASRRLVIGINPEPHIRHKLRVVKKLRLDDSFEPEGVTRKEWIALLDHFDGDDSVGMRRGVFYLAGDIAEVDRYEAAALLRFLPSYFEPTDLLSEKLLAAIARGKEGKE